MTTQMAPSIAQYVLLSATAYAGDASAASTQVPCAAALRRVADQCFDELARHIDNQGQCEPPVCRNTLHVLVSLTYRCWLSKGGGVTVHNIQSNNAALYCYAVTIEHISK
jgi:hypothetical protein